MIKAILDFGTMIILFSVLEGKNALDGCVLMTG
jgi:hypothetical protein